MNGKVLHTSQIVLNYDENKKNVVAKVVFISDIGEKFSRRYTEMEKISYELKSFSEQEGLTISELIDRDFIVIKDDRLKDDGVIIPSGDKYNRIVFDYDKNKFVESRLTRKDHRELGLYRDVEKVSSHVHEDDESPKPEVVEEVSEKEPEVVVVPPAIKETTEDMMESDGAIPVVGEDIEEEHTEHQKSIKNLRIGKKLIVFLGLATAVVLVGNFIHSKKSNNSGNNSDNNPRYDYANDENPLETSFNTEDPSLISGNYEGYEIVGRYHDFGSESDENMKAQIQYINDQCFSYLPCNLDVNVVASDSPTIRVINWARNSAVVDINNKNTLNWLMNEYVKYIFEGSTMFNNEPVKAFNYLSPYAKYIVVASAQSILQRYPEYGYSSVYNVYNLDNLTDSFDDLINQQYRQIPDLEEYYRLDR